MQWDNSAYGGFSSTAPWESLAAHGDSYNVSAQLADSNSVLNDVKWLISLRKKYSALRRGNIVIITNNLNNVFSYMRPGTNGSILVLVNLSGQSQNVSLDFTGSGLSSSATYPIVDLTGYTNTVVTNNSTNTNAGTLTSNYPTMYLRGVFNNWTNTNAMSLISNNLWEATIYVPAGQDIFKFDALGDWSQNWGDSDKDGIADVGGSNITNSLSGNITFRFNDQTLAYTNF